MAIHSSTIAWKIPWTKEPGRLHTVPGVAKSQTQLSDFTSQGVRMIQTEADSLTKSSEEKPKNSAKIPIIPG